MAAPTQEELALIGKVFLMNLNHIFLSIDIILYRRILYFSQFQFRTKLGDILTTDERRSDHYLIRWIRGENQTL